MTSSLTSLEKAYHLPNSIAFYVSEDRGPMLILSEDGFVYNGETIVDGGEAYDLFKKWLNQANIN
jgi:hypothetical protein